ncbi:MAG: hypothetical protein AAF741_06415 [Bacteroidota bacterium]
MKTYTISLFALFLLVTSPLFGQDAQVVEETGVASNAMEMAERQTDHLSRLVNLTERQRKKVLQMYADFNESFMDRRSKKEGRDQGDIRSLLKRQSERRTRELSRILTEDQYKIYLETLPEDQRPDNYR